MVISRYSSEAHQISSATRWLSLARVAPQQVTGPVLCTEYLQKAEASTLIFLIIHIHLARFCYLRCIINSSCSEPEATQLGGRAFAAARPAQMPGPVLPSE